MSNELTHSEILEIARDGGFDVEGGSASLGIAEPTVSVLIVVYGRKGPMSFELQVPFSQVRIIPIEGDAE